MRGGSGNRRVRKNGQTEPVCTGDTAKGNFFSYGESEDGVYPNDTDNLYSKILSRFSCKLLN